MLYVLAGQYEHAGVQGERVIQADQASVAQELGGDPGRALAAPKHALQRKLLEGLRYLLKTEFKLNQPGPSDGWLTRDALWLVSKTVSDKLRAHLLSQGIEGIPSNNTAVFNVLQDHGIALPAPDGKAIWKATVASDTGWSTPFTFLKVSPALIWEATERPEPFAGTVTEDGSASGDEAVAAPVPAPASRSAPASQSAPSPRYGEAPPDGPPPLMDLGQPADSVGDLLSMFDAPEAPAGEASLRAEPAPLPAAASETVLPMPENPAPITAPSGATPSGEHFLAWLRQGILTHKLIINDARALVHTVADTAYLVSPGVFQRYAREHPQTAFLARQDQVTDWQWVQKRFEKLRLHRKQDNGLNIWTCEVNGPRKTRRVHGYLLDDPQCLFDELPANNPYLSLPGR